MCYPPGIPILAPEMIAGIIDYIIYAKKRLFHAGHAGSGSGITVCTDRKILIEGGRAMELWFSDYHTEKSRFQIRVQKQLFGLQTEFQRESMCLIRMNSAGFKC